MKKTRYDQTEYIWHLKLRCKGLENRLASFERGDAYVNIHKKYEAELKAAVSKCKKLESQLVAANRQNRINRNHWFEVYEDIMADHAKEIDAKNRQIERLEQRNLEILRQRDEALEKVKELQKEYYRIGVELEEEQGKNAKLTAQVNKDFQNSSIPSSSQGPGRKKIPNSREKTGRKRGGQAGHTGHRLSQRTPDITVHIPDPEEYLNDPDYYPTGKIIKRQRITLRVEALVKEYTSLYRKTTEIFSRRKNREPRFIPGVTTEAGAKV